MPSPQNPDPNNPNRSAPQNPQNPQTPVEEPQRSTPRKEEINPQAKQFK